MTASPTAQVSELRQLAATVERDPRHVATAAARLAARSRTAGDDATLSAATAVLGRARRLLGEVDLAEHALAESIGAARRARDTVLEADAHLAMAGVLALGASASRAFGHLEEAARLGSPETRAAADLQRAVLCHRFGRMDEALELFSAAVPRLETAGATLDLARVLANRGGILGRRGDLRGAIADYQRARALFTTEGQDFVALQVLHNLGWALANLGDVIAALRCFDETCAGFLRLGHDDAVPTLSRAEVLLAAGMSGEAVELAGDVARRLLAEGNRSTAAEALVLQAQAARVDGDAVLAMEAAAMAQELFSTLESPAWARASELEWCRSAHAAGRLDLSELARLQVLQAALHDAGDARGEAGAATLGCLVAAAGGASDVAAARADVVRTVAGRFGLVELRMSAALTELTVRIVRGDRSGAARAARRGLDEIDRARALLPAGTDAAVETHTRTLVDAVMRMAASSRRPFDLLWWIERTRAAVRFRATPGTRPDAADDERWTELRTVAFELRHAELSGEPTGELRARRRTLERQLQEPHGHARGGGAAREVPSARELRARIVDAADTWRCASVARAGDELVAVVVGGGRATVVPLGHANEVVALAARAPTLLGQALTSWVREPGGGIAVDRRRRLATLLQALDDRVLRPLPLGDGPVVLSMPAALSAVPWPAMRSVRGRPVVLAPSLAWWSTVATSPARPDGGVVVAAGPRLAHAAAEAERVARCHPHAQVLTGRAATVASVLGAFREARLAHVVAHGHVRHDSPSWSTIELADGPVTVHELARLDAVPDTVVLASCGSGLVGARAGEQLVGLTTALLTAGSRSTVVAAADLPDDDETVDAMVALHRDLAAGGSPAVSLASRAADPADDPLAAALLVVGVG